MRWFFVCLWIFLLLLIFLVLTTFGIYRDDRQSKMKLQHSKECKGLIVHIRYLEAKFIRESVFRSDLTYQKQYLLVLLTQFEKRLVKPDNP